MSTVTQGTRVTVIFESEQVTEQRTFASVIEAKTLNDVEDFLRSRFSEAAARAARQLVLSALRLKQAQDGDS